MLSKIPLYKTIAEYNQAINIPLPRHESLDVRDFAENMKTVRLNMPAFRPGFYQLALLESGGGTVSSGGKAFDLGNFSLFFNQPGQIVQWQVPSDWRGFYLSIEEAFYTSQLAGFNRLSDFPFFQAFTPAFSLKAHEAEHILSVFESLYTEYHNPTQDSAAVQSAQVSLLLAYALRFYHRETDEVSQANQQLDLAERFQKELRNYGQSVAAGMVTDHLSVSDFAATLAVSAKHLSEVVKQASGQSPIEHINHMLVAEAQKLLLTTAMSIKEVGYYLGFSSPSYFNRLFKKLAGVSPSDYRKAN